MFSQHVKHYHQWLRTAIPFKTKFGQIPSDSVRVQGPSKRPSSGHLYLVSSVKKRNRKGGKCKISRVYSRLFLLPKLHQRWRPVIDLSRLNTFLHVEKFQMETRVHQDLSDSRGMGIVNRSVRCLPAHPHPPKLKEIPKVLLQVSGVSVHLPPIRTSHSPLGQK